MNPGLPHCRQSLYCLSLQGSPLFLLYLHPYKCHVYKSQNFMFCLLLNLKFLEQCPAYAEWQVHSRDFITGSYCITIHLCLVCNGEVGQTHLYAWGSPGSSDLPNFGNGVTVSPSLWCDLLGRGGCAPRAHLNNLPSRTEVTGSACSTLLM